MPAKMPELKKTAAYKNMPQYRLHCDISGKHTVSQQVYNNEDVF